MAYQGNKPIASDKLQASQDDFLKNYQAIDNYIAQDHYTFGDGAALEGKHKAMRMKLRQLFPSRTNTSYSIGYRNEFQAAPQRPSWYVLRSDNQPSYPYNMQINSTALVTGNPNGNSGFYSLGYNIFGLFFKHAILPQPNPVAVVEFRADYPVLANQPAFANVYTVMIQTQDSGFFNNDGNADIQVIELNPTFVRGIVRIRAGNILANRATGTMYITVIGSI